MLSHFLAVYLALLPFAQCIPIHEYMTQEEVLKTFQTDHNNVPTYEVVRLYHTLHKRDINDNATRMVKLNALGRNLSLYLEPVEGLLATVSTPLWTAVADAGEPGGLKYTQKPDVLARIGQAYQDVSKMSAVVAYDGEDGETLVQGTLLDDLSVIPLPPRLHDIVLREKRDLEDFLPDGVDDEVDFRRSHHHIVFKRQERDMNANHDGIRLVKRKRRSSETSVNNQSQTSIPDIVYPELLVIVDSIVYKAIGKNLDEVARYILAFWNTVDLRYRLLEEPVIRLNIAGIIISLEPRATPYLGSYPRNSTVVNADIVGQATSGYLYRESHRFPFATYDIAMIMTGLDLCTVKADGSCDNSTIGSAYWQGACNRDHVNMTTEAVGIVEDNGSYDGVMPTAHELAHLMGVLHDGEQETIDCPATDGYLMAPAQLSTVNDFQFSNCSLKYLYDFLSSPKSTCLRNKPRVGQALPRLLAGQFLTVDEQCEKIYGTKACNHGPDVCTVLPCYLPGTTICVYSSGAVEGTSCGDEMVSALTRKRYTDQIVQFVQEISSHDGEVEATDIPTLQRSVRVATKMSNSFLSPIIRQPSRLSYAKS